MPSFQKLGLQPRCLVRTQPQLHRPKALTQNRTGINSIGGNCLIHWTIRAYYYLRGNRGAPNPLVGLKKFTINFHIDNFPFLVEHLGIEPRSCCDYQSSYLASLGQAWPVSTSRFTSDNVLLSRGTTICTFCSEVVQLTRLWRLGQSEMCIASGKASVLEASRNR